jgi:hypothetical protein
MGRPRKINVNELRQINGQVEAPKTVQEVTKPDTQEVKAEVVTDKSQETYVVHGALAPTQTNSISSILKKYRKNIYGNYNEPKEYVDAIRKMSLSELHAHAIDVSVIPTSDKEKLIKNLENAFGIYINKQVPKTFPPSNLTVQASKNIEEIIAKRLNKKQ